MSEADSPKQPMVPTPIETSEIPAVIESIASEVSGTGSSEWQTVDFPGAMSVDAIPSSNQAIGADAGWHATDLGTTVSPGIMHYGSAEISPASVYVATIPSETLEPASTIEQEPNEQQSCQPTREHLQQLVEELERSHQTAQRQQILVETLTAQLDSSQERIAQLERDCALTQQRHNEQLQQVLQAENTCRDLRLRLHRQQQQTLQFKAALEKCLEMPTAYGHPAMADVPLTGEATTSDALSGLLPKNSPVQPWSLAEKAAHKSFDLPRPLFRLLNGAAAQAHDEAEAIATPFRESLPNSEAVPTEQSSLLDSDDPQFVTHLMQLIFPAITESAAASAEVLQAEPLLDCNGVSATDEETASVNAEALARLDNDSQAAIANDTPAPLLDDHATDPLWDDLATLIDPPQSADPQPADFEQPEAAIDPAQAHTASSDSALVLLEPQSSAPTGITAIPPIFAADAPIAPSLLEEATATAPSPKAWTWRDRLVNAGKAARAIDTGAAQPSKRSALYPASQPTVNEATPLPATSFAMPPSPIVYPMRSSRKLASLAAVDLPTFPKRYSSVQ